MQTNFLDFNDTYLEMTGFTREDLLTKSCIGLSVPEDYDHAVEALKEVMEKGFLRNFEKTCIVKDGKRVIINMAISLMPDKQRLLISTKDITEQNQIVQALVQSENRLQEIIEMEPECVKIMDENGYLTYMNPAGLGMIEADSLDQVKGALVANIIAPESRIAYAKLHKKVISGKKMTMQYEVLGLKGGRRWLETHAVPMQVGDKTMHLAVTRDISERKKLEDALKRSNEHLQELVTEETAKRLDKEKLLIQQSKMAMMGEMIGAIAHQWRQPLNALGISVQDAHLAYKLGDISDEYMEEFKTGSMSIIQRMSQTIDDFRNFFRPNKEKEEFILEDAVNETLSIMLPQLIKNNIELFFNSSAQNKMFGYKSELEQVILIIISNAKDALTDNKIEEPKIDISITTDSNTNKIFLSIEDNGGGVPTEIIDRIFEPYFTTKHQAQGTGIGLYMTKEIIERQMGGKIYCENSENGARFVVELPVKE